MLADAIDRVCVGAGLVCVVVPNGDGAARWVVAIADGWFGAAGVMFGG